ncbi:MAG: glycosyltransferase [Rhodoferax sp.]|nr:glycosyltransferase [Rhodoferax sp.]
MRLKIAVLSRNFSTTGGGAERYAVSLVEQLAARHEVHVFTQHVGNVLPGVAYHLVALPLRRPRWINQLYFATATWWATRCGFDVVHSHENTWHGNVQTVHVLPVKHNVFRNKHGLALALRWLKVLTSPRLLTYLCLERWRYAPKPKRRVVLTSQALLKDFGAAYPEAHAMVDVIAPGVASAPGPCSQEQKQQARINLGLPVAGRGLLLVGNDFRKKGLPTLLQALAHLPEDVWLAVAGQSRQMDDMRTLVQRQNVAHRVFFLGALSHMDEAYQAADCLVHPTLEDTYAMVVLEAMAHGLPVVVSGAPWCGISVDLQDGANALLLTQPQSPNAVALAVKRVLDDAPLAVSLGAKALSFAAQRTWSQVAEQHEAVYSAAAPRFKQRWLVLSHAFNMDGRAASQTITDKLPHLERAGIELVILSGVSGRQDTRYEHHSLWPAGPAGIRFEMRHVLRKHLGSGVAYRLVMLALSLPLLPFMLIEKLLRPVESSWSWWLSAYGMGLWLTQRRKFDLIYSTGGAFAAHVAGAALKRATGIRWLAEVHDPMVVPGTVPHTPQQKMQAQVETLICSQADVAVWFTAQALASAKQRNPVLGERGHMVLPGVDAPPYALAPYAAGDKFVIGHFGSLSETRNLVPVIAALDLLLDAQPALGGRVELHVYGGPLDRLSAAAVASARHSTVRHFGRIETDPVTGKSGREQILQRMRSADVLLLLHGIEPICAEYIPSKMYEYLWMQRPILALVHRNPQMMAIVVDMGHTALNVDHAASNPVELTGAVCAALESLAMEWLSGAMASNGSCSPYTTAKSSAQLVALSFAC